MKNITQLQAQMPHVLLLFFCEATFLSALSRHEVMGALKEKQRLRVENRTAGGGGGGETATGPLAEVVVSGLGVGR